jgi:tetratricopeptide (TPR) repeat protein
MLVQSTDVIIHHTKDGSRETWVSERVLMSFCHHLTFGYLKSFARYEYLKHVPPNRRHQSKLPLVKNASWRYWKRDGTYYYDVATIPNQAPRNYRSQLPTDVAAWYKNELQTQAQTDLEAELKMAMKTETWQPKVGMYAGFYIANDKASVEKAKEYAKAAACLAAAVSYLQVHDINPSKSQFWCNFSLICEKLNIPLNRDYRRLQAKGLRILGGKLATEVVVPKSLGNTSAVKIEDPRVMQWLYDLRSRSINYTDQHIIRLVMMLCEISDIACPSWSWLEKRLYSPEMKVVTAGERWGFRGRLANVYKGFIKLAAAIYASECWMLRG